MTKQRCLGCGWIGTEQEKAVGPLDCDQADGAKCPDCWGEEFEEVKPMTREAAYDAGHYVFSPPPVPTFNWTKESWMKYVTYTVPIIEEVN